MVHVLGAVGRAGVVSLPAGSRVTDALSAAGEAADDADLARLNLARLVVDGERLYVPKVGETELPAALDAAGGGGAGGSSAGVPGAGSGAGAPSDLIDLNTADQTALETLPGIGPALAGRILAWRDEHGRFAAVEDLLDVAGIGDVRFAELQDRVRV
ncbi:comEA protein [Curtobacterium sp. PhB130]|nr:comEA protein [Curtobacterium sp. PhB130]